MTFVLWCYLAACEALTDPSFQVAYLLDHCSRCPECCVFDENGAEL